MTDSQSQNELWPSIDCPRNSNKSRGDGGGGVLVMEWLRRRASCSTQLLEIQRDYCEIQVGSQLWQSHLRCKCILVVLYPLLRSNEDQGRDVCFHKRVKSSNFSTAVTHCTPEVSGFILFWGNFNKYPHKLHFKLINLTPSNYNESKSITSNNTTFAWTLKKNLKSHVSISPRWGPPHTLSSDVSLYSWAAYGLSL